MLEGSFGTIMSPAAPVMVRDIFVSFCMFCKFQYIFRKLSGSVREQQQVQGKIYFRAVYYCFKA